MEVVGESADWLATFIHVPGSRPDMLVMDFNLLPVESRAALNELRVACPGEIVIVLIGHSFSNREKAFSTGADAFISKDEAPDQVAEQLRTAAGRIHAGWLAQP